MKQVKLTKHCDSHLFAHLYEHIYFIQLDTALRDRGLFDTVDYSIDAYTEDSKVIFDIDFYSDIDIDIVIHKASLDFLSIPEFLDIGLAQLESEYERSLEVKDPDELKKQLLLFNNIDWNDNTIHRINGRTLTVGKEVQTYELRIVSNYSEIERWLKPLYRQVCGLTLNILLSDIADTHGGFVTSEAYATDQDHSLIGTIRLSTQLSREELDDIFAETKKELLEQKGYERLCNILRDITKLKNPPSAEHTLRDTGIMMDEKKWQQLATAKNLHTVLKLLHFRIM